MVIMVTLAISERHIMASQRHPRKHLLFYVAKATFRHNHGKDIEIEKCLWIRLVFLRMLINERGRRIKSPKWLGTQTLQ